MAKQTEEKEFKKYITYYFLKKGQHQEFNRKKKEQHNKLMEKAEKLEELDKKNEERRRNLFNKMKKMDKKREEIIKAKFEKILEDKIRREEKVKELQKRQAEAEKEDYEASKDIIAYQIESMNRSMNNHLGKKKRANSRDNTNTVQNQIAIQKNLAAFNKKLCILKSQSVTKKTKEEKLKIFKELKRQEAERKRKEKEDEMYAKGQ